MRISDKAKQQAESCRFCWMCRHVCPIGNADGQERNNARARALMVQYVIRGTEKLEDISDNMYECTLCGACTNNCKTGWDPKIFIQEVKTQIILEGKAPQHILQLLERYMKKGNVFGAKSPKIYKGKENGDVLLLLGQNAALKDEKASQKAVELLEKGGLKVALSEKADDTGYALWFLTGKTNETVEQAKKSAEEINKFKRVVVYNPVELSFMLHQWKEWGIEVKAELVPFNKELLKLIKGKKLAVKKSDKEYSLQDNYAYARELDDENVGRELIKQVGISKDMLLIRKEANLAGHLIMNEYMPEKMALVAKNRWFNAINMGCTTLVTENPDEHVLLKDNAPKGYRVITIEEMILENL